MSNTAPNVETITFGEVRNFKVSFAPALDSEAEELLTGTPTVAEDGSDDLTIQFASRNSEQETIENQVVAANQAVLFTVSGQQKGQTYTIKITVTTSEGQTLVRFVKARCPSR